MEPIPYRDLETVFLDVGNTLVSMDFDWICHELAVRGVRCDTAAFRRAEAAARPAIGRWVSGLARIEDSNSFPVYLQTILDHLPSTQNDPRDTSGLDRNELVAQLNVVLKAQGTVRLWSTVLPGVPQALRDLRQVGLTLVAVSNSDGTVEHTLEKVGLREHFDAVIDSTVVAVEKPDPRIFQLALDKVNADPFRTLHVGDLYEVDVVGARAAGLHVALVDPFGDWSHVDCERVVDITQLAHRIGETRT